MAVEANKLVQQPSTPGPQGLSVREEPSCMVAADVLRSQFPRFDDVKFAFDKSMAVNPCDGDPVWGHEGFYVWRSYPSVFGSTPAFRFLYRYVGDHATEISLIAVDVTDVEDDIEF